MLHYSFSTISVFEKFHKCSFYYIEIKIFENIITQNVLKINRNNNNFILI